MSLFLYDTILYSNIIKLCNDYIIYRNNILWKISTHHDKSKYNLQEKCQINNSEFKLSCVFYGNIIYITQVEIEIYNYPEKNIITLLDKILYTIIDNIPKNTIIALYKIRNIKDICEILENKIEYHIHRTSNPDLYNIVVRSTDQ